MDLDPNIESWVLFITLAESARQLIPVCSVMAGVTLGVAFIEGGQEPSPLRSLIVNLLTASSVSLMCSIFASAFLLFRTNSFLAVATDITFDMPLEDRVELAETCFKR